MFKFLRSIRDFLWLAVQILLLLSAILVIFAALNVLAILVGNL